MDPTQRAGPEAPATAWSGVASPAWRLPLVAVDVGNSRIKLALFERLDERPLPVPSRTLALARADTAARPVRDSATVPTARDHATLDDIAAWLAPLAVDAVCWSIGSVARDTSAQLVHWLRQRGCPRIVLLAAGDLPLVVSLPRPDMVGIDRLLNAVAANRLRPPDRPVIIVDLGTAVTVDLVSAEGAFLGGAILPGIGTSARAMHEFTDLLPLVDMQALSAPPPELGTATVEALSSGLYWGAIGAVRELIARLAALAPAAPRVLLTGGAAPSVAGPLMDVAELMPHLTLAGIALSAAE